MSTQRSIEQLEADCADELLTYAAQSIFKKGASHQASVETLAKLFVHSFSGFIMTVRDYYPTDNDPIPLEHHPLHSWVSVDEKHVHLHAMFLSCASLVMESQLLQNSGASKETVMLQIRRAQNQILREIHNGQKITKDATICCCNKVGFSRLLAPEEFYDAITQKRLPSLITFRLKAVLKDPEMGIQRSLDELKRPLEYILNHNWFFALHAQDPKPCHVAGSRNLAERRRLQLTTARAPAFS